MLKGKVFCFHSYNIYLMHFICLKKIYVTFQISIATKRILKTFKRQINKNVTLKSQSGLVYKCLVTIQKFERKLAK
jgi:hypothetical protein